MGTHVHPWWIHVNVWQNQYSIVKQNKVNRKIKKINKIRKEKKGISREVILEMKPDIKV